MNQEGLLFPKEAIRKKTKEASQKHHKQRYERSMLHLPETRVYGTPSHLRQRKSKIFRTVWPDGLSLSGVSQDFRGSRT